MSFELPGWVVLLLWILLALAGLAILVGSTRGTLRGMDVVLGPPERDEEHGDGGEQGNGGERGDGGDRDDGDSVGDDHDRGAPER
ncbi:hypothetical protein SGUI_2422 [Serinicoccus hydrothermalis]|uniref:Uncharacterized protein n=1 Tax=Serinicoccus hydrothermalis TaxID=1758689 RepID=A0A1B1NEF4_9MICO|nr:hypothetical protein [Serinicoccus hydrothermalis]ANS79818.1 hypothetical protein SGUI_2422 [Serinicoccus hydrothermalis]